MTHPRSGRRRLGAAAAGLLGLASSAQAAAAQPGGGPAESAMADSVQHVVLDVPYVAQSEALCGGAAVAMTLRYWGDERVRSERFAAWLDEEGTGIRTTDLVRATAELGWETTPFRGRLVDLDEHLAYGRPVVALIRVGPDRYHYVVVVGRVNGRVVFHDPAVSPYRWLDGAAFEEAWDAADRWAMLILPGPADPTGPPKARGRTGATGRTEIAARTKRAGPADRAAPTRPADSPPSMCAVALERGVELARGARAEEAFAVLEAASAACPAEPAIHRELSALLLREGRAEESATRAERALALAPSDRGSIELLAAARYLQGDEVAALDAWGRLGPVIVEDVTLAASTRTRQSEILRLAGLELDETLTAPRLALARRRLAMLPAAASTRLDYRPASGGSGVRARIALAERPVRPGLARLAAETGLAVLTDRGMRLRSASPLGGGELWSLDWRWKEGRRRVAIGFARPVGGPLPGVLTIGAESSEESYAIGREDRRGARVGFATWLAPALRIGADAGVDRWIGSGAFARLGLGARLASADDRLTLDLGAEAWTAVGARNSFRRGRAELTARSRSERRGLVATARLGGTAVSTSALRSVWPGAGSGSGRDPLARGHDLLVDGRVAGPLFGRSLAWGGVEGVWWRDVGPAALGGAIFVDAAAAAGRQPAATGLAAHIDAGAGLRIGLPDGGTLRLDIGRGLRDGATALSAGLETRLRP